MKFKASLHLHTQEDLSDGRLINYDIFKLIDEACKFKFKILALTCHKSLATRSEFIVYARERGILLIPGIELELIEGKRRPHVVVLNADSGIMKVKNLADLRKYKIAHPDIFVLAAHPNSDKYFSLGLKKLIAAADIFDGFEHTWFYFKFFNPNLAVARLAVKLNKPLIATADLHDIKYLAGDYTTIEAEKLTVAEIIKALKQGKITNSSQLKSLLAVLPFVIKFSIGGRLIEIKSWLTAKCFYGRKNSH